MRRWLLLTLAFVLASGCAGRKIESNAPVASRSNEYFDASIMPVVTYGPIGYGNSTSSFLLKVVNKTDKPLEVVWEKTQYTHEDVRHGGFIFLGISFKNRFQAMKPTPIPPKETFSKEIYPSVLANYAGPTTGWILDKMKPGLNGIILVINTGADEIHMKLNIDLAAS